MVRVSSRIFVAALAICSVLLLANCAKKGSSGVGSSCVTDTDCSIGTICSDSSKCIEKSCSHLNDCGAGQVCTQQGQCSKPECGVGNPCSGGAVCQAGVCIGNDPTCTDDKECTGGDVCKSGVCRADGSCGTKAECKIGETCDNGACKAVAAETACVSSGQCGNGQFCDPTTKKCVAGCAGDNDCGTEEYCNQNARQCQPGCRGAKCTDGRVCDAVSHQCKCDQAYCDANGGGVCNTNTGTCSTGTTPTSGKMCQPCTDANQCGPGGQCSNLGGKDVCTKTCTKRADCPENFVCYASDPNQPKQCVPVTFNCNGCITAGCASGQTCNFGTGDCMPAKNLCEKCDAGFECGPGNTCYFNGTGKQFCVQLCNDVTCPNGTTCKSVGTQGDDDSVKGCLPDGGTCDACKGVSCTGQTPVCHPDTGKCVECSTSTSCGDGKTCNGAGKCVASAGCTAERPYSVDDDNNPSTPNICVECQTNTDCPNGKCVDNECEGGGTNTGGTTGNTSCANGQTCGSLSLGGMGAGPALSCYNNTQCYSPEGLCANDGHCNGGTCTTIDPSIGFGFCSCSMLGGIPLPIPGLGGTGSCFPGTTCVLAVCLPL